MSNPQNEQLAALLAQLRWSARPERFAVIGLDPHERHVVFRLLPGVQASFLQFTIEPDMLTLLLPEQDWRALRPAFPHARVQQPFRVISFDHDLPADLVGFLATITAALAHAGVPLLAVCGFSKDHILVREQDLDAATGALAALR